MQAKKQTLHPLLLSIIFTCFTILPLLSQSSYVLVADKDVEISHHSASFGDIFAHNDIEFSSGLPSFHYGNLVALDDVKILRDNTINGDATAGDEVDLSGGSVITGTITEDATLDSMIFPVFSFTAGGNDVEVSADETLDLAPGSYGEVEVKTDGVLNLSAGEYFLTRFELGSEAVLNIDATDPLDPTATASVIINVTGEVEIFRDVKVAVSPDTAFYKVYFNYSGDEDVKIGKRAYVQGNIVAPHAKMKFNKYSTLKGAAWAYEIKVLEGSVFMAKDVVGPTAAFSGTPTSGDKPLTVTFTDNSSKGTGDIASWAWAFGDDSTSADQHPVHVYDTTGTFTVSLTVKDVFGLSSTKSMTNYIRIPGNMPVGGFVFAADRNVEISHQAESYGDIFANNDIEFSSGLPSTHHGNLFALDDVEIQRDNTIEGDASAGDEVDLSSESTISGVVTEEAELDSFLFPVFSFTAGGDDVEVSNGETHDLASGSYDEVEVKTGGTLNLAAGEYFINKFEAGSESVVNIDVTDPTDATKTAPVTINVTEELDFFRDVVVNIIPMDATAEVTFNFSGVESVNIGKRAKVLGTIIAPTAKIKFNKYSVFKGAAWAYEIKVLEGSTFMHHSTAAPLPKIADAGEDASAVRDAIVPEAYALDQNYPNPFNPTTTIQFAIAEGGHVDLRIFNSAGQLVRTLASRSFDAGQHSLQWDATDHTGSKVASGVYFYQLTSADFSQVKKMLLMK